MSIQNLSLSNRAYSLIKRSGYGLAAAAMALSILVTNMPHAAAATTAAPRVTFTFDDGLTSARSLAAPTLQKYGFSGTNYVISDCVGMTTAPNTCHADTNNTYMAWAQINELKNTYGWEVGSHTKTHPCLATDTAVNPDDCPVPYGSLTAAQVENELTTSQLTIGSSVGTTPTDFATPYGDWTPPVLAQIAKTYASHRGFADTIDQDGNGIIDHGNTFPYNDYLLYDLEVQAGNTADGTPGMTVAQVKSMIDQTIANNQWLVLTFHDIVAGPTATDYQYLNSDLDQIAAYIKSKNIQVVNINGGLANGTNLVPNSGFDQGIGDGWTTDNTTAIKADNANHGSYSGVTGPQHSISLGAATADSNLFSPYIPVTAASTYVFKAYLNMATIDTGSRIAFYVEEYDAAGTYLTGGTASKKAEVSVWVENLNFEFKPTSPNTTQVRLKILDTANTGTQAYLDNVQLFAETGATTTPTTPPVTGGLGGGTATPSGKNGDLNASGRVDITDLSILLSNWGKSSVAGNLDSNPIININDLSILLANWG